MSAREVGLEAYFLDINRHSLLTAEEEKALSLLVRKGDPEARDKMVRSNLRLVVSIAKHYVERGLPLLDLIEEGNLGLLKAVERFDPAAECRFSTYGTWWIKQSIKRALIDTVKSVRIPSYMVETITKWKKAAADLAIELGRPAQFHEIAERMEIPMEKTDIIKNALLVADSVSQTISIENSWTISDIIEDPSQTQPHASLEKKIQIEMIHNLLGHLDDRETKILRMRYGLDNGEPMTLKEIGQRVNLSRERVRQIENDALGKLQELVAEGQIEQPEIYDEQYEEMTG
ncbi:MAG: sigma-70 family RNA polymerase sigma factor [Planctomycetes bacterium]|jgi:RNA polymerase primary sigma factor|nr:sigma-70 family RNA polymerase sigma factor [Planctomycetota bacterium]MBT6452141.1 sigma-70 family RNA polymerase sigma factor [Planctomycetota bacterium]MBT6542428.1 sigma-70 family RNA polymerase sigma factor [Planctomycetota bacterium]MBT6783328.1 sigma-70 family RNA polymerase sigma factor [Planctomycetota bacterium]MBT6969031.1 sigma-70 family RNA polymerase sigma factor [Planctomycetota bacterium]